jgi:hypothetical protein
VTFTILDSACIPKLSVTFRKTVWLPVDPDLKYQLSEVAPGRGLVSKYH